MAGFLQENNGSSSATRLMCLMSLVNAMGLSWAYMYSGKNAPENMLIVIFLFAIGAFAPKLIQKFAEQKLGSFKDEGKV
jgi:hypothetical protein